MASNITAHLAETTSTQLMTIRPVTAGFFAAEYKNNQNLEEFRCQWCRGAVWIKKGEQLRYPWHEHARRFTGCLFLQIFKRPEFVRLVRGGFAISLMNIKAEEHLSDMSSLIFDPAIIPTESISKPFSWLHSSFHTRIASFISFPRWQSLPASLPVDLCEAGMFYTNIDDNVQCFMCGGILSGFKELLKNSYFDALDIHLKNHVACPIPFIAKGASHWQEIIQHFTEEDTNKAIWNLLNNMYRPNWHVGQFFLRFHGKKMDPSNEEKLKGLLDDLAHQNLSAQLDNQHRNQATINNMPMGEGMSGLLEHVGKDQLVEHVGKDQLVEHVGMDKLVEHVGIDKLVEHAGIDKLAEHVGKDKLVEHVGKDQLVQHIGKDQLVEHARVECLLDHYGREKLDRHFESLPPNESRLSDGEEEEEDSSQQNNSANAREVQAVQASSGIEIPWCRSCNE